MTLAPLMLTLVPVKLIVAADKFMALALDISIPEGLMVILLSSEMIWMAPTPPVGEAFNLMVVVALAAISIPVGFIVMV